MIRKFSDPPLTACPTCGAEVQKLLSAPAIQFKGTGWYITDYARKGGSGGDAKAGAQGGAKGESGKGESTKAESSKGESAKSDSAKSDSSAKGSSSSDSSGSGKT